ncbi:hypothetical protein [Halioxenophilus sp. WMMB6]|uniref:hypothetical protein n=1 Tax=Halioxenophilus sp. WMMB6 TaxID=3073815 RepID=UPI00295E409A|nr:hypothetical protein [Halioxenophilus sp. WMMB6]
MARKSKNNRSQLIIILVFVCLVFTSVGITSFTVLKFQGQETGAGGYKNVTLTDAYLVCETKLKQYVGESLHSYGIDDLSTRYDQERSLYLVFFSAQIRNSKKGESTNNYVTCQVDGRGAIDDFWVSVEREDGDGVHRRDKTNPFGYEF